jgi:hypothetical protein
VPDLEFAVQGAGAVPYCAAPTLALELRLTNRTGEPIQAISLDCQIRIEAQRRRYAPAEKERLADIFGEPERWGQTLRSLLWTHAGVSVPPFQDSVAVDLNVPCTADFNVLAGKYFQSLEDGLAPISLHFSGTIFYAGEGGALQVTRVPWSAEAAYDLPVAVWREVIELYFPNAAWLSLRQDVYDLLRAYRVRHGLTSWEQTLEKLLQAAHEETPA